MDHIPRHGNNENDPLSVYDLNRIQNLSLEGHNQKPDLEADEFKKRFKDSFFTNFGGHGAPCLCGVPMYPPDRGDNVSRAFPNQKLYSPAEDPTLKKYSPLVSPTPRKYTLYTPAMCKELVHLSPLRAASKNIES